MSVESAWHDIELVLRQVVPGAAGALQPGLSKQELQKLDKALGVRLPPDLHASLLVHNGQAEPYMSEALFDNQYLLPASLIRSTWKMRNDVAADLVASGAHTSDSVHRWWDRLYVPITDSDGDGYCVHAHHGTVSYFVHDDGMKGPVAGSMAEWLERIASALASGTYRVDLDCVWLDGLFEWEAG